MRIIAVLACLVLVGCAAEPEPASPVVQSATILDCSAAVCTRATYTPVTGGIEAGQGLPHLGCFVSVPGCFDHACRSTDADRAWCGTVAMVITHPTP